jgi:hypothetical protein
MSPISYFYHDIIHAFHYYNHTLSKKELGFDIIQSNTNKIILYEIISIFSSIDEEIFFRKKLSNNIKLILFFLIHEENIGYDNLHKIYDKLLQKTYHKNYTNEYFITSKILDEYERDIKFETCIKTLKLKYYTDESITIFRKNLMLGIISLQYIIKNISSNIFEINDNLKKWTCNEILDNIYGENKEYFINPETTFTYIDDYKDSEYLSLINQIDIIDYKNIFSEIIKIKSYTDYKYISAYDILVNNINKKDITFIRNIRTILVKTIIKITDYNILNIIFVSIPNEDKLEFIYQYITNLYLGIEKKVLLFIELCNYIKSEQHIINIEFIDRIILNYKDYYTIHLI